MIGEKINHRETGSKDREMGDRHIMSIINDQSNSGKPGIFGIRADRGPGRKIELQHLTEQDIVHYHQTEVEGFGRGFCHAADQWCMMIILKSLYAKYCMIVRNSLPTPWVMQHLHLFPWQAFCSSFPWRHCVVHTPPAASHSVLGLHA